MAGLNSKESFEKRIQKARAEGRIETTNNVSYEEVLDIVKKEEYDARLNQDFYLAAMLGPI